jgi:hypothetical protein
MGPDHHGGEDPGERQRVRRRFSHGTVMAGHSRSKNGVASLAYARPSTPLLWEEDVDARHTLGPAEGRPRVPGMTSLEGPAWCRLRAWDSRNKSRAPK